MSDDMVIDLDLNQAPLDPPPASSMLGLGSILSDLESTHGRIEDRIRQLEAVTARARQRQRWRLARNNPETSHIAIGPMVNVGSERAVHSVDNNTVDFEGRSGERGKGFKRDSSHLVANALKMDTDVKMPGGEGGSFYDCNICLDTAKEPILTCCGHLFCWSCFYQLSYVNSTAKECPVCKGEVTDTSITPIYGNGNDAYMLESESGLKVPPRPRARRIESIRQQRVNGGISHIPVAEALRRIRISIGVTGEHLQQADLDSARVGAGTLPQVWPNAEAGGIRRLRSRQFSRVMSESAASLSNITSALNNAERLVEDLGTYINDRLLQRNDVQGGDPFSNAPVTQSEFQSVDSTAEVNPTVLLPSSSGRTDGAAAVVNSENMINDVAVAMDLTMPRSSSFNRRRIITRASDLASRVTRELRRRRLSNVAVTQSEFQSVDTAEVNPMGYIPSSSRRTDDPVAIVDLESSTNDTTIDIDRTVPLSSSSSPRIINAWIAQQNRLR